MKFQKIIRKEPLEISNTHKNFVVNGSVLEIAPNSKTGSNGAIYGLHVQTCEYRKFN